MSKFYQRYISGAKKTSEEEKILNKPINSTRQVDPTALAPSHISKRPVSTGVSSAAKAGTAGTEVLCHFHSYHFPEIGINFYPI